MKLRTIQHERLRVQHDFVPRRSEQARDIPSGLQPSQLQEALIALHGLANKLSALRLSLCPDNNRLKRGAGRLQHEWTAGRVDLGKSNWAGRTCLFLLDGLIHEESRSESRLLGNLVESGHETRDETDAEETRGEKEFRGHGAR